MRVASLQQSSSGVYLSGTEVSYKCEDGYEINQPTITCGLDGKWSDVVVCYPSLCFVLYTYKLELKNLIQLI